MAKVKRQKAKGITIKRQILLLTFALNLLTLTSWAYTPGRFYSTGHTKEKIIALTFDDGPGPITPALLEYLKDQGIRATFFMSGNQIEEYTQWARAVHEQGHEIGNHTYRHFNYRSMKNASPERLVHELKQTEASLRRALRDPHFRTQLVRMPYGYFNRIWLLPTLKKEGYALVHWTFGGERESGPDSELLAEAYIQHARPGAIFLFHDGGRRREKTLEAVRMTVTALLAEGYRFVSAEELLLTPPHEPR